MNEMQHDYHNPGNGYNGTFSMMRAIPQSGHRSRGKHKGNKAEPRTRVVALSDTKVYKNREDYEAGKVAFTVDRTASRVTAQARNKRAVRTQATLPEVARLQFRDAGKLFGTD